ncbi:hypothetical protein D3C75_402660 [compost metagenome]
MNISLTKDVQNKIERNRNLLDPLRSVIYKLEHRDEYENRYIPSMEKVWISHLGQDVSVIRQGNTRVYFTKDDEHIVILDID